MGQREWQAVFRSFAKEKHTSCKVTMERQGKASLTLDCRLLSEADYDQVRAFELTIMDGIPNNYIENIYQPFDEPGLRKALGTGWAVGLFAAKSDGREEDYNDEGHNDEDHSWDTLAAFLYVIPRPEICHNVLMDVAQELGLASVRDCGENGDGGLTDEVEFSLEVHDVMIADCILVSKEYRGYGLQKALFYLADCMAAEEGISRLCGTASPKNAHSIRNFEAAGYRCVAVKPKYRSERCFFVKEIIPTSNGSLS